MSNEHFLSTTSDEWIEQYREDNPIWIATLNSGLTVYRDDGRWVGEKNSAWERLRDYCIMTGDYIVNFRFGFRSNMFSLAENSDGYFFVLAVRSHYPLDTTLQLWKLGYIGEDGKLYVRRWFVPEMLPDKELEERPIEDVPSLIRKSSDTTKNL